MKTSHRILGAALLLAAGLCLTHRSTDETKKAQAPGGAEVTRLKLHVNQRLLTSSPPVAEEGLVPVPESPAAGDEADALRAWLRAMAATDPEGAAAWIESLADEAQREEATRDLATAWAERHPVAALAWVRGLTDAARREQGLEAVCLQIAQQDPVAALTAAIDTSLPTGGDVSRLTLIENLTAQWADRDVQAALQWARQIPDDTQREAMLHRVTLALATSDPQAAASLVATELTAAGSANQAVLSVVHQWAQSDPAGAAAWVSLFPDGPRFGEIVQNLIGVWGEKDADAAEQWLATLPSTDAQTIGQQSLEEARKRMMASARTSDGSGPGEEGHHP